MRNRRKGLGYSMIQMWKDKIREKGGKKHLIFWTVYWGITLAVIGLRGTADPLGSSGVDL